MPTTPLTENKIQSHLASPYPTSPELIQTKPSMTYETQRHHPFLPSFSSPKEPDYCLCVTILKSQPTAWTRMNSFKDWPGESSTIRKPPKMTRNHIRSGSQYSVLDKITISCIYRAKLRRYARRRRQEKQTKSFIILQRVQLQPKKWESGALLSVILSFIQDILDY